MVATRPRFPRQSGKSRAGCLLTILILILIGYSGFNTGTVYYRYWRFSDGMKQQARAAPGIEDEVIRRRLLLLVEELKLPVEARRIRIRRTARPREIRIGSSYEDTLVFPLYKRPIRLNPEARQPL
jgi:hypothetical protein